MESLTKKTGGGGAKIHGQPDATAYNTYAILDFQALTCISNLREKKKLSNAVEGRGKKRAH